MKKILHITEWHISTSYGGTEVYLDALCTALSSRNIKNSVIIWNETATPEEPGVYYINPRDSEEYNRRLIAEILQKEKPEKIFIHSSYENVFLIAEIIKYKIPYYYFFHTHSGLCNQGNFRFLDKYSCTDLFQPLKCTICRRPKENIVIGFLKVIILDILLRLSLRKNPLLCQNKIVSRQKENMICYAEKVIVFTSQDRDLLIKNRIKAEKILCLPQELSKSRLSECLKQSQNERTGIPRFGYIGRCCETKGVKILVEAVMKMSRDIDFELEIYGCKFSNPFCEDLRKISQDDPRIKLYESIPPEMVPEKLGNFDVFCIPSTIYETGPLTLRESVYSGCYVVGSDKIGQIDFLKKYGQVIEQNTPECWKNIFERCVRDIEFIRVNRRREFPDALSMDALAEQLLKS